MRDRLSSPKGIPHRPLPGPAAAALPLLSDCGSSRWLPRVPGTTKSLPCGPVLQLRFHLQCALHAAAKVSRGNKGDGGVVRGRRRYRASLRRERLALHAIDQRTAIQWRDSYPQSSPFPAGDREVGLAGGAATPQKPPQNSERLPVPPPRAPLTPPP